jgi:hypothetical protein
MYTEINFKTKKALKDAIAAGRVIYVYQPNALPGVIAPTDGEVSLEGPHFPKPHMWYATGTLQNGKVVKVR